MQKVVVEKNTDIDSLAKALDLVSKNGEIFIKNGFYKEKIIIKKDNIKIIGESKENVIIAFDDYSLKIHEDKRDYNTFRTATMIVKGNNCSLENISIMNLANEKKYHQAIALEVLGNNFKAKNCYFTSYQDTLFLGPLPDDLKIRYFNFLSKEELFIEGNVYSKFINCEIEGAIDFIFGSGSSLFENCTLISSDSGYVFAPSHSLFQNDGFYVLNCTFKKKNESVNNVYISRPWRSFGKTIILNCFFENHIIDGYDFWNNPHPEIYNRFYEYPFNNKRNKLIHFLNDLEYQDIIKEIKIKIKI